MGSWHKASVSGCLPLAAPIGLSPLLILTLCGPERVLVVSTEPLDDLSCLTTLGVRRPGDGAVARAVEQVHSDAHSESMRGCADSSTDLCALGVCICRITFLTGASDRGWGGGYCSGPASGPAHEPDTPAHLSTGHRVSSNFSSCTSPGTRGQSLWRGRGGGGWHKALVVGSVSLWQRLLASRP